MSRSSEISSLWEAGAWAAVAVVLMKNRGMTAEQAVAEVLRMKVRP
jgi:hypothetical protein